MDEKKRVLQVNIDNNGGNGAFTLVMYFYNVLREEYIFDFFTMGTFLENYDTKFIVENGGKIYSADLRKNRLTGHIMLPFRFHKFLRNNKYGIVHIHSEVAYKVFLYAIVAKVMGVKKIIIHAHSDNIDGNFVHIKKLLHKLTKNLICRCGTDYIAISESPASWLFNDKVISNKEHFYYVTNGIMVDNYRYNEKLRNKVRRQLGFDDESIVVGHVGALKKVKNQEFIIDIINILAQNGNYKLLFVGDGEDRKKLEEKTKKLNLSNVVTFLGSRDDVNELMQAMDVFVFPSLFEGIPMTLIEAQTVGLPIVASDIINKTVFINKNISTLSLDASVGAWASTVQQMKLKHIKEKGYSNLSQSKYNIENGATQLKKIYR